MLEMLEDQLDRLSSAVLEEHRAQPAEAIKPTKEKKK
jgi:hypothetical protein